MSYSIIKPFSLTLQITLKDDILLFRPYDHDIHHGQLKIICQSVYNGLDFVPHVAHALSCDPLCAPYVLCGGMGTVAFINLRLRKGHSPSKSHSALVFVDSVRVREDLRGHGLATALLSSAFNVVQKTFQSKFHGLRDQPSVSFLSVTNPANKAMRSVFRKLNWSSYHTMYLWPLLDVLHELKGQKESLLDAMKLSQTITAQMRALSEQWAAVHSADQILLAMNLLQKRGASHCRPLYYDVESAQCASNFLNHELAQAELRSVWRLDINGEVHGLLFVRPKIIDQSEPCSYSLLSACVVGMRAAESCVAMATERLQLKFFHLVFDAALCFPDVSHSKVLRRFPGEHFIIYRRGDAVDGEYSNS